MRNSLSYLFFLFVFSCFCCSCCFPLLFCLMPKMRKSRHKKWKCETAPAKQQQQQQEEGHKKAGRRKGWGKVRGGGSGNATTTIRHKNCESVYKFNFPAREFHIIKFFKCKRFKATLEKRQRRGDCSRQKEKGAFGFKVPKKNGVCVREEDTRRGGDGTSLALTYEILTGPTHIIQKSSAWAWQGQRQQCVGV